MMTEITPEQAAERALNTLGGARSVASMLGLSVQAVSRWRQRKIPVARALEIEAATEGKVTRYEMRPDIFEESGNEHAG